MAAYYSDSSSDTESIVNVQVIDGRIKPYRHEPVRKMTEETVDGNENGNSAAEREIEDNPFIATIDFESRLVLHVREWCTCDQCLSMDNPLMNLCCHELEALQGKLFAEDLDCMCLHSEFHMVVLAAPILRTALVAMKDVTKKSLVEPIDERTYRLAAYRQFTWWTHNRLGKSVQKVIPSCVVKKIRETYPDPNGQYTGFREADETDIVYPD